MNRFKEDDKVIVPGYGDTVYTFWKYNDDGLVMLKEFPTPYKKSPQGDEYYCWNETYFRKLTKLEKALK